MVLAPKSQPVDSTGPTIATIVSGLSIARLACDAICAPAGTSPDEGPPCEVTFGRSVDWPIDAGFIAAPERAENPEEIIDQTNFAGCMEGRVKLPS
jgi:hypothetical protein